MSDESNNVGDELPPVLPTEVPPAPPTAIPTELPPEQPTAVSAETSTAATTMETDLKIFQIDNEILAGTGMPPSPAGASAAAGDGNATGASTEDESGGENVADANGGAQLYAIDDDSVKTEDSASSSSYSSSASTESSNDSESSTSSEDPSEIGGVKIEEIDDTESEEEEEEAEEVRDAVLLKEDVEMAEKQASANNNSLMYDDDDEISYKESFGDATNIISNGKQQQFRKGGRKSKKRLGQDRASVRKMVGQKMRGRGWDNRRKYLKKMSRAGVEGGMDLESGNNGDGASGRINNRPSGWTAAYKRRRIWYCCFSTILIIVGVSLLIYGVAKERAVSRSNANNFDDELFYDDEFLDDGVNSPAQSPSRPTTPGGQPSPSAPFPSGVFEPTGTPTYAGTMMPTLNPTPSNTPELTSKPVVATDNALLSLLKIAYADNLEDDSPDILEKYEKLLDRETYMNAPYSEQSIQWRSYEYIYNQRTDVMDNNNVLLMDEERILQIYGLLCFYHNFQWMQEGAGECLWSGVTCRDVREGEHNDVMYPSANDLRVVSLDVRGNGPDRKDEQPLEGELPLELMFLPYLETLVSTCVVAQERE